MRGVSRFLLFMVAIAVMAYLAKTQLESFTSVKKKLNDPTFTGVSRTQDIDANASNATGQVKSQVEAALDAAATARKEAELK
ncbi:MAG: hypothetical protein IPF65_13365 [Polaromonas sp.]|jgi:pectin methylesterase-like acyl-CoA thioesterase|nr:hypothetical protein [Polaromonas sp.]MBP6157201.1 hypothetical protein [Polaromonas sp.]